MTAGSGSGSATEPATRPDGGRGPRLPADLTVFRLLVREEWRLHAVLFGGLRFLFVPVLLGALGALAVWGLAVTGTPTRSVVAGLHVLAFGFGLYAGTAGLAGSDMLERVLGDVSPLLATAGTLPVSERRLLGLFLVKDAGFYGVLFVGPMALAAAPLADAPSVGALAALAGLWGSLLLTFAVGMVCTLWLIAARTRGAPPVALVAGTLAALGAAWWAFANGVAGAGLLPFVGGVAPAVAFGAVVAIAGPLAVRVYDPTYSRPERTATDRFAALAARLPGETDALTAKTLLDLTRSSGGLAKPVVSVLILFALVAAMIDVVADVTGLVPAPGIFFGAVLGLSAFTTYNWLTSFDSVTEYLVHPVSVEAVFRAKRTAFLLVGTPTVAIPYVIAVVVFDASAVDALAGGALLCGLSLYYYGLTVYVAGFSPNEFLFDAARFSVFTVGVAAVLLPALLVGFVVVPPTPTAGAALAAGGAVVGLAGLVLSRLAGPRWARRYQRGG